MSGGIEETSASCEARSAPRSYPTQGMHQRRERLIAQGGAPRVSTWDAHDATVAGLLRTVAAIDVDGLADHVRVTTRAGQTIDQNSREAGAWQREAGAWQRA